MRSLLPHFAGVELAQRKYLEASGDEWLWEAPEYLITTSLFDELAKLSQVKRKSAFYLTLESNVKECLAAAGARGRGAAPRELRHEGRFDLVLWGKSGGKPRAAVEIKNQVYTSAQIANDVNRLTSLVKRKKRISGRSSFQFAALVFYTSICVERNNPRNLLKRRINKLLAYARSKGAIVKPECKIFQEGEKDAWAACCFVFEAESK